MGAAVARRYDGRGLAGKVLNALSERAIGNGLQHVLAPIRPTGKHRYPSVAMAEYASWQRSDGLSVDSWIRTHQRMGAVILGAAVDSMVIEGTVAEWESWTGLSFPTTGEYVVPDALNLLHVDRAVDRASYREENVWVQHR